MVVLGGVAVSFERANPEARLLFCCQAGVTCWLHGGLVAAWDPAVYFRAYMADIRQSRPNFGRGFQFGILETF